MSLFVKIEESETSDNTCYMSKDISEKLSLSPGRLYKLKFGRRKTKVKLETLDTDIQSQVKLGPDLFSKLTIPEKLYTGIAVVNREIVLGPVLGVFVNPSYIQDLKNQTPRPSTLHMLKANESSCLFIYFFTIEGADWQGNKIEAWYYSKKPNKWLKRWLPLPDVVYDRGVGFLSKEKSALYHYRDQFTPTGTITRVNSTDVLDKYWLHERLKKHEDIKQYLPETLRYNSIEDVTNLLGKHKVVYLKSFYGSCGTEVMTISARSGEVYKCTYFDSDRLKEKNIHGKHALQEEIQTFFEGINFVVQQGIDLLQYDGSRMDMRILIQKNGDGVWTGVYNVAIRGQKDSLITAGEEKGARFFNFTEIMPLVLNMSNDQVENLDKELKQACIRVAKAIEQEYGPFGEIGMDMALDKNLKIWFIEANSKPDRELESGIIGSARVRATCLNIIDYTKYLAGFH